MIIGVLAFAKALFTCVVNSSLLLIIYELFFFCVLTHKFMNDIIKYRFLKFLLKYAINEMRLFT